MRELTGSKGRAALGATAIGIATAIVGSLDGLRPEVAIALIVGVTIMATAYIVMTGLEDKSRLEKERAGTELESMRLRQKVEPAEPAEPAEARTPRMNVDEGALTLERPDLERED